jgi:hypothetical protein
LALAELNEIARRDAAIVVEVESAVNTSEVLAEFARWSETLLQLRRRHV